MTPVFIRDRPLFRHVRSSCSGFHRVIFHAVYSSKLESNIVALSLEHIRNGGQCSYKTRTCTELCSYCGYTWITIIDWRGPALNSRPGLYLLKYTINPQPLNGTGFYSEEASIRGNMLCREHNTYVCTKLKIIYINCMGGRQK